MPNRPGSYCANRLSMPFVRVILASLLLMACGSSGSAGQNDKVRVVATFSILADLARNVGGDRVEVATLVGPNADAHTFEPSPGDNASLVDAGVILSNGLGFEPWLDEMYESSGSKATRVIVTDGIQDLLAVEGHEGEEHEGEANEAEAGAEVPGQQDEQGEYDPHVWHDAVNTIHMVGVIRDAFSMGDPVGAETYEQRAEQYTAELRELDNFVQSQASSLPEARRKLVTTHDTFGYFARRYGFGIVQTALGITTDQNEPSAAEIATLVEEVKAAGVPAIFAENVSNSGVMRQIARETGARLAPPLYTDALGASGSEGETYLQMMRYNITTIVTALNG